MARTDTGMYGQYTGPMTDRAEYEDPLGGQDIHPQHAPGTMPPEVIQHWLDMLLGRGDQYTPDSPGGIMGPGGGSPPGDYDPQQLIQQLMMARGR